MLCNHNNTVNWWIRNKDSAEHIKKFKHNPTYLQSVQFESAHLHVSSDIEEVVKNSDTIFIAVPSAFVHQVFKGLNPELFKGKTIVSAIKGIIPEYHSIPVRYFHKQLLVPYDDIGLVCGPCHAEEVALERLSYLTIAFRDEQKAKLVSSLIECRYIKTQISDDIFGTEISAILKNVFAIASGICHGLGYGDNFQAVLISNGIQEIERFVDAVNPTHRDVKSSAYLGDLLVTAYSQFSRNRTFGNMIGKGYSVKAAQLEMNMVAEGYYAVKSIIDINKKFQVDIPITLAVYHILYEKISPVIEMKILADKLN